jgi:hypothetical protein
MIKRLFGGLLMGAGFLVMTTSGLCSLIVVIAGFSEAVREPSALLLPLVVGGIPFAMGFGMFRWGQWLLRPSEDDQI